MSEIFAMLETFVNYVMPSMLSRIAIIIAYMGLAGILIGAVAHYPSEYVQKFSKILWLMLGTGLVVTAFGFFVFGSLADFGIVDPSESGASKMTAAGFLIAAAAMIFISLPILADMVTHACWKCSPDELKEKLSGKNISNTATDEKSGN